ncbi:equilibrative nucleobase transporter 1-like [Liolophura sinensis]|uniref:equilibrative nucleobase transporter 1-like n=1 Tax=Liolophura sinensis TaxID=3198878 RepID=UPI0031594819
MNIYPSIMAGENLLKGFMVICGSLEIMLFGGIIFGWASLVYVYKDEGYFRHLCPLNQSMLSNGSYSSVQEAQSGLFGVNISQALGEISSAYDFNATSEDRLILPKVTCKEQDNQFNLIFSISTVFTGIMCFVNGLLYDRFGTRLCRVIAIVCFIGAMLCLIFASPEQPLLLYPGATLLVYGGYLILVTNLQLANLIPRFRSTIMSLYAGSYDCSAVIFLAFKAAHEAGIKVNTCFLIQACAFSLVVSISTFFTLPKYHFPWPLPENFKVDPPIQQLCQTGKPNTKPDVEVEEAGNKTSDKPEVDKNKKQSSPHLDGSQKVSPGQPLVKTPAVSRLREIDMSSQNCLLAINHVPRLSTSMLYHSNMSINRRSRLGTRTSVREKTESVRSPPHHLSLLNIPQIQRTISHDHRPSVSLDSVNFGNNLAVPSQRGLMPSGHNSAPHSSPAVSPFLSLHSVAGISSIGDDAEGDNPDLDQMYDGDFIFGERETSLRKELCSPLFIMEVAWMSFQRLRSWLFVGVFNPWITTLAAGDQTKISYYTSVFSAMQFFGIFTAPMSGRLMDRKPGKKYQYNNPKFERLHAAIPSFVLNCTVVLLLSICAAVPVLEVQYITFALHVINRSFIYGPNSAFVANAFPFEYFGILLGTTLTLSAIFGMVQYPLFLIIQGPLNDDPMIINVVLILLMLLTYVHPAYIWIYLTRKLKKKKLAESSESSEPLRKKGMDDMDQCDMQVKESTLETENIKSDEKGEEKSPRDTTGDCEAELYADENKCTHL